jgi:hypothetical protein
MEGEAMPMVCRTKTWLCEWVPDDEDVFGHAVDTRRSATTTITWTEDPDGTIEIRSDDPEADRILRTLLERAGRMDRQSEPAAG